MSKKNLVNDLIAINPKNQIFVDEFTKLIKLIYTENSLSTIEKKTIQINNFRIASFKKSKIQLQSLNLLLMMHLKLLVFQDLVKALLIELNKLSLTDFYPKLKN